LILHSLPQLNNVAGSNAGCKFSRDIRDHSQHPSVVSGGKMQIQPHDFAANIERAYSFLLWGYRLYCGSL